MVREPQPMTLSMVVRLKGNQSLPPRGDRTQDAIPKAINHLPYAYRT
jgi:hypothetical protein